MANVTVGLTPSELPVSPGQTPVIQNLGPGILYIDHDSGVSTASGLEIGVGSAYEWPRDVSRPVYAVADAADTDVRIIKVG